MKRRLVAGALLAGLCCLALGLGGCLFFNDSPKAFFSWNPLSVLAGQEVIFDASGSSDSDGTIDSYSWDFGDGNVASGMVARNTFADHGSVAVTLTVTDNCGAEDCKTLSVNVGNPAPQIGGLRIRNLDSFECNHHYVCNRIEATLDNVVDPAGLVVQPSGVVSTTIDWGDGSASSPGPQAIHRYQSPGTYTITGTATDNDGATASVTQTIIIEKCVLVEPVLRVSPRISKADLGSSRTFEICAWDPDFVCDQCRPCPTPCPSPCPTPCPSPCETEVVAQPLGVQPECGGGSSGGGDYNCGVGIVRIHVNVENPCGDVVVYEDHSFEVNFDLEGTWTIRVMVWDDDCGCSKSAELTFKVEVEASCDP